jgi:hypothetical protein
LNRATRAGLSFETGSARIIAKLDLAGSRIPAPIVDCAAPPSAVLSWAEMATIPDRPGGVTALSLFFVFGATMSGLTAFLLSFPGTFLDAAWQLNPRAHEGFASMGGWAVVLMIAVCAACTTAAIGLWRCERWGYLTAVTVLAINLAGDTLNAFVAHDWRTLIGLPVGGVMIAYLVTRRRRFVP